MSDVAVHQLFFIAEDLKVDTARVIRAHAHEGLSHSYKAEIEVVFPDPIADPAVWVLKSGLLFVARDTTVLRRLGGTIMSVRERATRGKSQRVTFILESPLARLRLITDHRIFQNQTTKDIVSTLLADGSVDKVDWRLSGSYPEREVCTQFGETSFAFMSRILEEDGIFYFFEHADDGTTVVFADAASAYVATEPESSFKFQPDSLAKASQAVLEMNDIEVVRPAKVTLWDHDFKRPRLDLEAIAESQTPLAIEHYDYPGRYVDPEEGKRRAQLRLDGFTAASVGARGRSTIFSLLPGHTFDLENAYDAALDRKWVVVDLITRWDQDGPAATFQNHFRVIGDDVVFRPLQRTPRAIVPGPHVAVVTGPAGSEIHPDEFGRVKVHFPWDRRGTKDDKSSCWVRVGQMHTSGSVAIPRVGWEVLVEFEDGDPDKPIIVGRLYNGKYGTPYPLPGNKTVSSLQSKSSPGGTGHNEIRANDSGGGESFHVFAQKDFNMNIANNKTEKVTTNSMLGVASNMKVTVGANDQLDVGAAAQLAIGATQKWSVGGSRTKMITADEKIGITGSQTRTIGGSHSITTPKSVESSTPAAFSETIGGSCIEAAAAGVALAMAGAASVSVGGAKIEVAAAGKSDFVIGAAASTIGGAFIMASGKDAAIGVKGAKATTVGGAWMANAAASAELSSEAAVKINVGGALAFNGATVVLKVGGSCVTIDSASVTFKSSDIKITATGPQPELAGMVEDI